MGKRIISQRRGRATRRFIAPSHRFFADAKNKVKVSKDTHFAKILELVHSISHTAPLAKVEYDDGEIAYIIAPEGIAVGDVLATGKNAEIKTGNTLELANIPEGTLI